MNRAGRRRTCCCKCCNSLNLRAEAGRKMRPGHDKRFDCDLITEWRLGSSKPINSPSTSIQCDDQQARIAPRFSWLVHGNAFPDLVGQFVAEAEEVWWSEEVAMVVDRRRTRGTTEFITVDAVCGCGAFLRGVFNDLRRRCRRKKNKAARRMKTAKRLRKCGQRGGGEESLGSPPAAATTAA